MPKERIHPFYIVKRSKDSQQRCVREVVGVTFDHKEACSILKEHQNTNDAAFFVIDSSSRNAKFKEKFLKNYSQQAS